MKQLLILPLIFLWGVNPGSAQIPSPSVPAFSFLRLNNTRFTQNDLPRDKMLFFLFFDAECNHCQRAVQKIAQDYPTFRHTAIFLVSMDDSVKIAHFIITYGPGLWGKKNVVILQDKWSQFIARFKPRKYPSMFLYSSGKQLLDYEDNEESLFRFANIIKNR